MFHPRFLSAAPALAALLLSLGAAPAFAGGVTKDLDGLVRSGKVRRVRCIVQTYGAPSPELATLLQQKSAKVRAQFGGITGIAVDLPAGLIHKLALRPDVELVSRDVPVKAASDGGGSTRTTSVSAPRYKYTGRGVGVAVIDSGIDQHPDLTAPANRIAAWLDLVNGRATPYDDFGHGTHVAGLIAGSGGDGTGFRGHSPDAHLIGIKVLDANGSGRTSNVIRAIEWAVQKRVAQNIRVINLSLGQPAVTSWKKDPLCRAVHYAWQNGIVVVTAAGNYGRKVRTDPSSGIVYGAITSPGNAPLGITVGGTNTYGTPEIGDDVVTTYSSRGPTFHDHLAKPDLVAPGNRILSTISSTGSLAGRMASSVQGSGSATYLALSGTSQAAPVVAATAAMMIEGQPSLTPNSVKVRLMHSAVKQWNPSRSFRIWDRGAGLLDVSAAIERTETADRPAASPEIIRTAAAEGGSRLHLALTGGKVLWGSVSAIWGNSFLWGSDDDDLSSSPDGGGDGASSPPREDSYYHEPEVHGSSFLWGSDDDEVKNGDPDPTGANSFLWGSDDDDLSNGDPSTTGANSFLWGSDDDDVSTTGEG